MSQADYDYAESLKDHYLERDDKMFEVTDAKREMLVGSIGFIGASGAGKTLSMLKTAKGFMDRMLPEATDHEKWQKVGVIDTEHERSKIYAGTSNFGIEIGAFKHLNFQEPFSVERLDAAIKFLKEKFDVKIIIIDSISHFWEGPGGILELQQKYGGTYQAWQQTNPHYAHFVSLVTGEKYQIDMLNGIRAKQHYEVSQNEVGKLKVQKMGLKPTQRDSLEYEFHIAFNIDMDHIATTMKDNSGMFNQVPQQIETEVGEKLYSWLKTGEDVISEKIEKEKAEQEEKQSMVNTIESYMESKVLGMSEFATNAINATVKKFGELDKLSLKTLQTMVTRFNAKEQELKKEQQKVTDDVVKQLDESQKEVDKQNQEDQKVEEMLVKDLREVAKTFKIEGYSKMLKPELIDAIKVAQAK